MNAIMKTNNVSMISNIINGKLFNNKKSYLKEIDNFSLNSFFYNQRIRRFKELVLLELIFKHGSKYDWYCATCFKRIFPDDQSNIQNLYEPF